MAWIDRARRWAAGVRGTAAGRVRIRGVVGRDAVRAGAHARGGAPVPDVGSGGRAGTAGRVGGDRRLRARLRRRPRITGPPRGQRRGRGPPLPPGALLVGVPGWLPQRRRPLRHPRRR
jgi:hypothetical protein